MRARDINGAGGKRKTRTPVRLTRPDSSPIILHHLDKDGGFTCGDTKTGRTSYAYPTSVHATTARRRPDAVAAEMMDAENITRVALIGLDRHTVERNGTFLCDDYDAHHWRTLDVAGKNVFAIGRDDKDAA